MAAYRALRNAKDPAAEERYLNARGMDLVNQHQLDAGVAVFKLNTVLYPAAANTWDSLGFA